MVIGICKLTLNRGKFVKSHIIPKALTYSEKKGQPFMQGGRGTQAIKRWSSWYDQELVIAAGESVLRDLDTWAIPILRNLELVWSGWGNKEYIDVESIGYNGGGYREINIFEPAKFRRFLLSILWRAAASKMPEFSEIVISAAALERLRKFILEETTEKIDFFSSTIIQISTKGIIHNHSPISQILNIPAYESISCKQIPIFRFYFDGLIIHFYNQTEDEGYAQSLSNLIVGNSNELLLSTITFERSFQLENLTRIMQEYSP